MENSRSNTSMPSRVALVGAGPSGLYAAKSLLERTVATTIDIYDRLPTPFGLVRYGIAPDNQKMKQVTRVLGAVFNTDRVHYFGNITFGKDITRTDLLDIYDAVIYAIGAQGTRVLAIPGQNLKGSFTAKSFVDWYNGLPDPLTHGFNLSGLQRAVVIGGGNVALDVARMLLHTRASLAQSDVPDEVLRTFSRNSIRDVHIIARRGPADCKFTPLELRRLGDIPGVGVVVHCNDFTPSDRERKLIDRDQQRRTNLDLLKRWAVADNKDATKRVHLEFYQSPVRIHGTDKVEQISLQHNEVRNDGSVHQNGGSCMLTTDLVFAAIGQQVTPLPGIPYDDIHAVIPNNAGRIEATSSIRPEREYVVGWAKRGASGVVGTNKNDSDETVQTMLADIREDVARRGTLTTADIMELLRRRGATPTDWSQWLRIDKHEVSAGLEQCRPRVKIASLKELLRVAA